MASSKLPLLKLLSNQTKEEEELMFKMKFQWNNSRRVYFGYVKLFFFFFLGFVTLHCSGMFKKKN
jgi:hypothetical protein